MTPRARTALIGALLHAPGLWLAGVTLSPETKRWNAVALGVTAAAMIAGGAIDGPRSVVIAWAVGHTAWPIALARRALAGVV